MFITDLTDIGSSFIETNITSDYISALFQWPEHKLSKLQTSPDNPLKGAVQQLLYFVQRPIENKPLTILIYKTRVKCSLTAKKKALKKKCSSVYFLNSQPEQAPT